MTDVGLLIPSSMLVLFINPSPKINPPPGRIAIVANGNSPDPDDLGGTAVSIALLRAADLEERLVHYSRSCDLVRGSRISERAEKERHALMQSSCDVTARRWGGYDGLIFYNALWQKEETIRDLSDAINASTAVVQANQQLRPTRLLAGRTVEHRVSHNRRLTAVDGTACLTFEKSSSQDMCVYRSTVVFPVEE